MQHRQPPPTCLTNLTVKLDPSHYPGFAFDAVPELRLPYLPLISNPGLQPSLGHTASRITASSARAVAGPGASYSSRRALMDQPKAP